MLHRSPFFLALRLSVRRFQMPFEDGWILASFFCEFMDLDSISVHIACKQSLRMGCYEICFRIAKGAVSRPSPSYSKANLGITHMESLFAGYGP